MQIRLVIDRATASRLGITPQALDNTLYDAFGQRQVSTIFTQLNQYHVVLEANFRNSPAALNDLYVQSTSGSAVPLSAYTEAQSVQVPLTVNHQGQFPAVTVSFNLAPGASLGDGVAALNRAQQELRLPPSIRTGFQGTGPRLRSFLRNRLRGRSAHGRARQR